jgi:uncharacterized membrane protein (DUF485 family)
MDLGKVAKDILGVVAPTLGTAIGGPFGGMAAKALSEALLGKSDGSSGEMEKALASATPEQLASIKKVEADFKVQMKALDIDLEKIAADDRASARLREMSTKDKMPAILGFITLASFFGYIGLVTFLPQTLKVDMAFVNIAIGWLGGTASTVVSYYFGSSSGSAEKNKLIAGQKN